MQLTQKERSLLEDAKKHEELCIKKYNSYSQQAGDPQLKQLFQQHEGQEQNHCNTVNQILQGRQPATGAGQSSQQGAPAMQSQGQSYQQSYQQPQGGQMGQDTRVDYAGLSNQADGVLCNDMLMSEKYISGAYDTAIFEQTNSSVRQALQHIQKEEQQHGEGIFNYMEQHGLYNPK